MMWTFNIKSFINNFFISIIMYSIIYIIYTKFYNKTKILTNLNKNKNKNKNKKGGTIKKNKCLVSQETVDKDYEEYYDDLYKDININKKGQYESINENNLNSNLLLKN